MPEFGVFAETTYQNKYSHFRPDGRKEVWDDIAVRVVTNVMAAVDAPDSLVAAIIHLVKRRIIIPGGRYLYAAGREFHQTNNCFLFRAEDSREGWADLGYKTTMSLMTGGGVGTFYGAIRPKGSPINKTGGTCSGPISLMKIQNETGREVMQGGSRRSAIWAGLPWQHEDIFDFIDLKNWSPEVRAMKARDFNFPATMDMTNISNCLDNLFFEAYSDTEHLHHSRAYDTFWKTIKRMCKTGEPGFSVDCGENAGDNLRNACTEVTSSDDSDVCNLISVNLSRINGFDEAEQAFHLATLFALAGSVYSHLPFDKVFDVRDKNRRLGVGIMGVHEWLMKRGKPYGPDEELGEYLKVYEEQTHDTAATWSHVWGLSEPVKTRAIAPTGTIGIVAETTTGIEPMFCSAYKRRYLDGEEWVHQFVVDPTARRMVDQYGADPESLEDAYTLAEDPERRVAFQAWVQQYVDHGISSTLNLPAWGSRHNNEGTVKDFGETLLRHLPNLRGITAYPDGARDGQPLTTVPYLTAIEQEGKVFDEGTDICDITGKGTCG